MSIQNLQARLGETTDPAQRAKIERRIQFLKTQPQQQQVATTGGGAGNRAVATGQAQPKRPMKFWNNRIDQGQKLGQSIAPELYDGSLNGVTDQYADKTNAYMDLLNERARNGMSAQEINQIEDRGTAEIGRAITGANRAAASGMARGGTLNSGGAGNALRMDIARGAGDSIRGLQSDVAAQNLAYKSKATDQYGSTLDTAANRGIDVGKANATLQRSDLAAKIGMTGTGIGLLEQTRQEGREDKRRKEDMSLQEKLEQMRLDYAKSLGAL